MPDDLTKFVGELHHEVHARSSELDDSANDPRASFTEIIMENLSDAGIIEDPVRVSFDGRIGRGLGRVDGYALADDSDTLDLFITIFINVSEPTRLPPEDVRRAIEQAVRYGDAALKGLHKEVKPETDAFAMTERIYEYRKNVKRVRIFILTDGISSLVGNLPDKESGEILWQFEVWDTERLSRLLQSGVPKDEIDVDFEEIWANALPCVTLPSVVTEYQAHLAIFPGELLFSLYDKFGQRLFEHNVRSFLQAKGKVNRGIRDSLKNEPARFMAFNNGISITAQEVELMSLPGGQPAIKRIKGLQIVNGGQTTASIHRARRAEKADLSCVFVPAKISVVPHELLSTLAPRIAQFANTQNPIQMADFSANDPFHIQIERLSRSIWVPGEQAKWFYERARGQYQVAQAAEGDTSARLRRFKERTPSSRRFTKIDLAKYLSSWDQLPHLVSQGGQMNFVLFMQRFRETHAKGWLPDEAFYRDLISKAILFKTAASVVRSEEFVAYRANIVTYLVATVAFRSGGRLDLKEIWQNQTLSTALETMMKAWSHKVTEAMINSADGRNVTQWAKKVDCWKAVMKEVADVALPEPLPPEFHTTAVQPRGWGIKPEEIRVALDQEEIEAIAVCRATEVAEWIRVLDWGQRTGALDATERQVISTLATLAAGGWQKGPSAKNAREARRIIIRAHDEGAFEETTA